MKHIESLKQFYISFEICSELIISDDRFIAQHCPHDTYTWYRFDNPIRSSEIPLEEFSYYGDGPWLTNSGGFTNFGISVREDHLVATLKELVNIFGGNAQCVEVMQ